VWGDLIAELGHQLAQASTVGPPAPPVALPAAEAPSADVLVVDDDEIVRGLLSSVLAGQGYAVRTAATVDQARAELAARLPDVAVVDVLLPDGTGFELIQFLRGLPGGESPGVVVVSARAAFGDRVEAIHCGADAHFEKPVDWDAMVETVRGLAGELVVENQHLVSRLLGSLKIGGLALVAFVVNLLLVPVVLFYLLRDWHALRARVDRLIPRPVHAKARAILREVDAVLAEFLRGQITVILTMSLFYVLALWLAGLEFALPIGLITGLLVFVPYVGALLGFVLGTVAALMQFDSAWGLVWVWAAFGVGQTLEGMVVTPLLVGERIGLHPVAVIFALLAFGQVFGFFGVLLALPASAALLVGLRHLRGAYLASSLYGGAK